MPAADCDNICILVEPERGTVHLDLDVDATGTTEEHRATSDIVDVSEEEDDTKH